MMAQSRGGNPMPVGPNRRALIAALGGAAAWPLVARAQQTTMPVVGFVDMRYDDYEPLALGLREVGFVDHRNVLIDYRMLPRLLNYQRLRLNWFIFGRLPKQR
jgi:hypothetical protein